MNGNRMKIRKPEFPASLTDLHRLGKTIHGHDGSSRIVMVRKTDQRTFTSVQNGQEPKLETITRETIETFRGQRTQCKYTTEKKDCQKQFPTDFICKNKLNIKNGIKKLPIMDFQMQCLEAHNEYRQKHGVAPLKLNKDMCAVSQSWANVLIQKSTLEHSNNQKYGENIYCMSTSDPNFSLKGDDAVKSWYEEIKVHKFGTEPKSLSSGHFTQVVWKESTELGVGFAKVNGKFIVVANYYPPGNVIGSFAQNVPPLGGFVTENNNDIAPKLSNLLISSKTDESSFEIDFLNAHNEYRQKHGVPPLTLDKKLCKYSEEWAKILSSKNNLEHRKNCPYGENIYCMYSSDPSFKLTGRAPVDKWYEEINQHPFGREPNNLKSGHFTQVIWKTSEFLGVGVAKSRQGQMYVVANYNPAGNFLGHFSDNVPPLLESPSITNTKSFKNESEEGPTATTSSNQSDFDQFALEVLKIHNEYRRKHGVPDLKLNKEICQFAKEWADQCSKTTNMAHRPNNSYGENIFYMYSSDFSHVPLARDVVKTWYDEVKDYVFGAETIKYNTLHFTQLVWKSTTELGVGMAKNSKGQTYVVANYSPRGNILSQFTLNVPKAKP
ncbi:hypothetical protein RN001_015004 [Aquatica leii]|uniref:SCP domain-containing protein n=1 Tax=Aquatica leii TaxID=1421715 RepID=A0AAN7PZ04_9COLE|nr:hypothetical protein RN001_015004 [Aquatica leii]